MVITEFIEKVCTKRHKKSGHATEEAPGWIKPEQASKRNYIYIIIIIIIIGYRACHWTQSSRVQTRPRPMDF
jgi:hypothetical protein